MDYREFVHRLTQELVILKIANLKAVGTDPSAYNRANCSGYDSAIVDITRVIIDIIEN